MTGLYMTVLIYHFINNAYTHSVASEHILYWTLIVMVELTITYGYLMPKKTYRDFHSQR